MSEELYTIEVINEADGSTVTRRLHVSSYVAVLYEKDDVPHVGLMIGANDTSAGDRTIWKKIVNALADEVTIARAISHLVNHYRHDKS